MRLSFVVLEFFKWKKIFENFITFFFRLQMRFRQWILSDVGPKPEHCYARSWLEDPKLSTALPQVQLFTDRSTFDDAQHQKIVWPPTIFTHIPDEFQCQNETIEFDNENDRIFIENLQKLLDEVHIAVLTCDSNGSDVVYWRLAIHRILMKLVFLFDEFPNVQNRLDWIHKIVCQTLDRSSIEHYVDLFRILFDEYPKFRSIFIEKRSMTPIDSLETFLYEKLLEKPNDFTEEVVYSLPLSSFPSPTICLIIPGLDLLNHRQRISFWQKNLSQIGSVFLSSFIDFQHRNDFSYVQLAYEDVLKKFHEIRQSFPNHKILFLGWNVGCVIALKAALVCPIATIVCLGLPWISLSDESKNDFTQITASILFVHGENFWNEKLEKYRQKLRGKNAVIEIGFADEQLRMSEQGKYQFRLTQSTLEKFLMEEIIDFVTILSPKVTRPIETTDDVDLELKKKKIDENSEEIFLFTGDVPSTTQTQTLSIAPEHDPQSIFVQTSISSGSTRKRKTANVDPNAPPKRGRQQKPKAKPTEKPKTTKKRTKVNSTPTATTSILNTLLQLPSHQPKTRPIDSSSFVNKFLSSQSFVPQ